MNAKKYGAIVRLVGVGWYVGICISVGAWAGLWADDRFGFSPMLTLVGIAVGLVLALAGMIRMLMAVLRYVSESD
jgi:uncharacterized membrane protein YcjF (UPF0283 family)|tara:strand:- start:277 stop:501 length:225 start_codon:yes stop_codon:yes gene_type:complete